MIHAYNKLGFKCARGEAAGNAILTRKQVDDIRVKYQTGLYSMQQLADENNVCLEAARKIIRYLTWKE
jgi:hypothetical protein